MVKIKAQISAFFCGVISSFTIFIIFSTRGVQVVIVPLICVK